MPLWHKTYPIISGLEKLRSSTSKSMGKEWCAEVVATLGLLYQRWCDTIKFIKETQTI